MGRKMMSGLLFFWLALACVAVALYMLVKIHLAPKKVPGPVPQPKVETLKRVKKHWLAQATGMSNKQVGVGATAVAGLAALGAGAYYEAEINTKRAKAGKPLLSKTYAYVGGAVVGAAIFCVHMFWDKITWLFGYRAEKTPESKKEPPTGENAPQTKQVEAKQVVNAPSVQVQSGVPQPAPTVSAP